MVKEIFFHYSEFKGDLEALQAGDDVEFSIKDRNVCFGRNVTHSFLSKTDHLKHLQSCALNFSSLSPFRGKRLLRMFVCSPQARLYLKISVLNSLRARSPRLFLKFPPRIRYICNLSCFSANVSQLKTVFGVTAYILY